MPFARINGVLMNYRLSGRPEGRTLVFSNSLGTDLRIWDDVAAALAGRYRILVYDKRGHGLSDTTPAPYKLDDHVGDLLGLLDRLHIDRFGIVGLSVGGLIAQGVAARVPQRLEALVLSDTAAKIGTADMWTERITALQSGGIESLADAVMERWFAMEYRQSHPDEIAGWRNLLVRTPLDGYAGTCAAIRDADLTESTRRITLPTLCIVGEEDRSTPPDVVRQTAELLPKARLDIIAHTGHVPCIDRPDIYVQCLERYFGEVGFV